MCIRDSIIAQCAGSLATKTLGIPAVMLREEKDTFLDDPLRIDCLFPGDRVQTCLLYTSARPILLAAPLMISSLVMNNILRYEGKANLAMIGLVTGGLLNIALDPLFMFGLGLGTAGAGIATALSQTISFGILLYMFLRSKTVSQFRLSAVTREPREFLQILAGGAPSFGRQGLQSIGGMLLNIAARSYGDAAVAGMSIVSRIFMLSLIHI